MTKIIVNAVRKIKTYFGDTLDRYCEDRLLGRSNIVWRDYTPTIKVRPIEVDTDGYAIPNVLRELPANVNVPAIQGHKFNPDFSMMVHRYNAAKIFMDSVSNNTINELPNYKPIDEQEAKTWILYHNRTNDHLSTHGYIDIDGVPCDVYVVLDPDTMMGGVLYFDGTTTKYGKFSLCLHKDFWQHGINTSFPTTQCKTCGMMLV